MQKRLTNGDAVWVVGLDGNKESCIRWDPDPPWEGAILGESSAHCKVQELSAVICAKMAELIEMPFEMLSLVDLKNHILDGGTDPTWEGIIL